MIGESVLIMLSRFPYNFASHLHKNSQRTESSKEIYEVVEVQPNQAEDCVTESVPVICKDKSMKQSPHHEKETEPEENPECSVFFNNGLKEIKSDGESKQVEKEQSKNEIR